MSLRTSPSRTAPAPAAPVLSATSTEPPTRIDEGGPGARSTRARPILRIDAHRDDDVILIFSTVQDPATNDVVPWLARSGREVVRINEDDPDPGEVAITLGDAGLSFCWRGKWHADADVEAVWYRKGKFWFPGTAQVPDFPGERALADRLESRLRAETDVAKDYFHYLLRARGARVLGNPFLPRLNKLIVLNQAREAGLAIPAFEVVDRLRPEHRAGAADYITKPLSDGVYLWDFDGAQRGYFSYTESLAEVLDESPERDGDPIPLSLIQLKIAKKLEVRTFYLDGEMLSAAIWSQNDPQTAIDYRKYNYRKPNRNVPIELPTGVAAAIDRLFRRIGLNTGSVDLIVDEKDEFVFLEINPTGQYTYVSNMCNFDIDRRIAEWLTGGCNG
ncbi:grasp-with-spasm system ATP-grasp peptide maturase [Corallococcus sp. AB050B]|nr:grasp-with-spasm system ATP-grasp peptide maturase [Corallococcus sp. AB050B]